MWTTENRGRYDRTRQRYPSDLTDAEWSLIKPLIPPAERGGNKRTVIEREIVNGLMYILSTGCQWAFIPKDLPPRSTLNDYFQRWDYDGTLDRIKGVSIDPPGYDGGKKIKGKKRHILVDTLSFLLHAVVHPADIQDRDGGVLVMSTLFGPYPFLRKLYANDGYQGPNFRDGGAPCRSLG